MRAPFFLSLLLVSCLCTPSYAQEPSAPETAESKAEDADPMLAPVEIKDLPPPKPLTPEEQEIADETAKELRESLEGPKNFEDYNRPLLFAPEDNKIEITNPQVRWDMNNDKINLGGLNFEANSMRVILDQLNRDNAPGRFREGGRSEPKTTNVSFVWPSMMARTGRLMIEDMQGKILWSTEINESERERWTDLVASDKDGLLKVHKKSGWGVVDASPTQWPFLNNGSQFRFCFSSKNEAQDRIRFCSSPYRVAKKGDAASLVVTNENKTPTVSIGKTDLGPRARVNFPPGKKLVLKVQFKSGAFAQIASRPLAIRFLDIVESKDGQKIILTGEGAKPLGPVKDLVVPPNHFWSATVGKTETIWQMEVSRELPIVRVLGAWNVPFTYVIRYEALPKESSRLYIHKRTGSGTYVNGAKIKIHTPPGAKIVSTEQKTKQLSSGLHEWKFQARSSGQNNYSRINITEPGPEARTWVAHYDLYRGHSYEMSARLTGIIDATLSTAVIGEVAAGTWFETLFGIDSPFLSNRRWGLSGRYFRALTDFSFVEGEASSSFSVLNGEVRYNIIPGIWNRDELLGIIGGMQKVEVANTDEQFVGIGGYWARSMPKLFDDIFNLAPFMRYPKYVDVELIYYPMALKSGTTSRQTLNLNFHGKVFWSKRVYGEAGFGMKVFDFISESSEQDLTIQTLYGTVGIGLVF